MAIEKVELKDALNALVTNTNIDKVTGVLGGVPSNIAKADLVSVVAGVLGNPSGTKGSKSFTDFNELTESGFYRCIGTNSKANKPPTTANGILEVIVADKGSSTFKCKQTYTVAVPDYNPDVFERVLNGENWTPWVRIDNFGYNTLADLASGVIGMLSRGELKIDANGLYNTGFYSFVDPNQQYNLPIRYGVLMVIKVGTSGYTCLQICFNRTVTGESADKIFYRTADASNVWSNWGSLS